MLSVTPHGISTVRNPRTAGATAVLDLAVTNKVR